MACSIQRIIPKRLRTEYKPLQPGALCFDPASFPTIINPEIYASSFQTVYHFLHSYCSSHYRRPYTGFIPSRKLFLPMGAILIANDTNYFPPRIPYNEYDLEAFLLSGGGCISTRPFELK